MEELKKALKVCIILFVFTALSFAVDYSMMIVNWIINTFQSLDASPLTATEFFNKFVLTVVVISLPYIAFAVALSVTLSKLKNIHIEYEKNTGSKINRIYKFSQIAEIFNIAFAVVYAFTYLIMVTNF